MPYYQKLGQMPKKHHIWFHRNGAAPTYKNEGIAYEHVFTTEGFDEAYSIVYHLRPPTRVRNVELIKHWEPKKVTDSPLRHHHFKTADIPRRGDLYTSRIPMLVQSGHDRLSRAARENLRQIRVLQEWRRGRSHLRLQRRRHSSKRFSANCLIARRITSSSRAGSLTGSCPIRWKRKIISSSNRAGPVRIPKRYLNHEGQIKMGAPYSERDLHGPTEIITIDKEEDVDVLVKDGPRLTRVTLAHHPFDVVGWDGYLYPFTFNAQDFEPITGTVHQPPPIHQTFEMRGYVICTFAPRFLDTHPEAVKIPWVHDNVEADEVLFYVRGNFGSRRGIESGIDHAASARDSARAASGHDHGEQRCAAHRRAGRDVRHRAHARTDRGIARARRSENIR